MRRLAEYTMSGRRQAILVVLLSGFLPLLYLISAAVVGLVNLRRGTSEGLLILLWALIPAGFNWLMGDPMPVIVVIGVMILAQVLRTTQSWQNVLFGAVLLGIVAQSGLQLLPSYVAQVEQILEQAIAQQQAQGASVSMTGRELAAALLSFFGAYHALAAIICMVIARWWQAMLYKPGGFRQEFHSLRLTTGPGLVLGSLILAGMMGASPFSSWLNILSIAPMITGLALMHGVIGMRDMPSQWLVLVYLAVLMIAPLVILLGLLDSVVDVRRRISKTNA